MAIIRIENMSFYAGHGCFLEEQAIGTHFRVDFEMNVDTARAQKSDDLNDTVNYLAVYQVVKQQMMIPSHLLEHVADRILHAVADSFPAVTWMTVKVSKLNPPLGGQIGAVSVQLEYTR